VLSAAVFGQFMVGASAGTAITSANLVVGSGATAKPTLPSNYLIYDKATGELSYDADGSGSGAAVQFGKIALVGTTSTLAFTDFVIVA